MPKQAPGNKYLRAVVFNNIRAYTETECRRSRGIVVQKIVQYIRDCCRRFTDGGDVSVLGASGSDQGEKAEQTQPIVGAFVKFEDGQWWEVSNSVAREKVAATFRDFLHDRYKSSTRNKVAKRRAVNETARQREMMKLSKVPLVASTDVAPHNEPRHQATKKDDGDSHVDFGTFLLESDNLVDFSNSTIGEEAPFTAETWWSSGSVSSSPSDPLQNDSHLMMGNDAHTMAASNHGTSTISSQNPMFGNDVTTPHEQYGHDDGGVEMSPCAGHSTPIPFGHFPHHFTSTNAFKATEMLSRYDDGIDLFGYPTMTTTPDTRSEEWWDPFLLDDTEEATSTTDKERRRTKIPCPTSSPPKSPRGDQDQELNTNHRKRESLLWFDWTDVAFSMESTDDDRVELLDTREGEEKLSQSFYLGPADPSVFEISH